jgi:hypothetical protein
VKFRDLVFREHEHESPPAIVCNYCSKPGCTLSAEIPLANGYNALVTLCSRGCESAFKREAKADEWLADFLVQAERFGADANADAEWPEEIDA